MKRLAVWCAEVLVTGILSAGALSVPAMAGEDYQIAVELKTLSSEYWQSVKAGIDKAAKDYGLEIDVQGPKDETEIAGQAQQLEAMLAQDPDAVIIAPLDQDTVIQTIEKSGYGGKVLFCDTDCDYQEKVSFVGISNEDAAYGGGMYGAEINGKDTKALILYGQEGDSTSHLRKKGYEKALEENGLEPVAERSGNNTIEGAEEAMAQVLQEHPDGINLVLCHNDDTAIGALRAVQAAGLEGISIIGFDGNSSAIELVHSGDLTATIAQQPALIGYMSVETAVDALKGEKIEASVQINTVIVDAANCMDYLPE